MERELYEVWLRLAGQRIGIRVRQMSPELAIQDVLTHRPGWTLDRVTVWSGSLWVTT